MEILSRSGSALVPSSVTTSPFSVTRCAVISSSALRRDATPDAAIIFCNRSRGMDKYFASPYTSASGRSRRRLCFPHWARGFTHRLKLGLGQLAIPAAWNAFRADRPQSDANPLFDRVLRLEKDAAQFFFLGVAHPHFIPKVSSAATCGIRLAKRLHPDAGFLTELRKVVECEHALYFDVIGLLEMLPIFQQLGREIAVIGKQDHTGRGIFQIADR